MKKLAIVIVCFMVFAILLSACKIDTHAPMIKSQRRFEKYLPSAQKESNKVIDRIDLSEGPKLKYNADLGPKDLNFDFKIVNPY